MRLITPLLQGFILLLPVGCAATVCSGQTPAPSALKVVVKEAQDLPLAGASCSLSALPAGKPIATAKSDEQGITRFTNVPPGKYKLTVAKEGFETLTRIDVVIDEKLENDLVVVLAVAAVHEKVTITAPGDA